MISVLIRFPPYWELGMLVRKMKSAFFVLAIVCLAILPGQLLAQGNGSGMVVNTPLSGGLQVKPQNACTVPR